MSCRELLEISRNGGRGGADARSYELPEKDENKERGGVVTSSH